MRFCHIHSVPKTLWCETMKEEMNEIGKKGKKEREEESYSQVSSAFPSVSNPIGKEYPSIDRHWICKQCWEQQGWPKNSNKRKIYEGFHELIPIGLLIQSRWSSWSIAFSGNFIFSFLDSFRLIRACRVSVLFILLMYFWETSFVWTGSWCSTEVKSEMLRKNIYKRNTSFRVSWFDPWFFFAFRFSVNFVDLINIPERDHWTCQK